MDVNKVDITFDQGEQMSIMGIDSSIDLIFHFAEGQVSMYVERIQLINYGPIGKLDLSIPFTGRSPKPIIIVGENGSGKSVLLSHIVNGLLVAQSAVFPHTPEVDTGKVYKLRSSSYIRRGEEFYFARVDFEDDLHIGELRTRSEKQMYQECPKGLLGTNAESLWDEMNSDGNDNFTTCLNTSHKAEIESVYSKRCVLYFPPNRFEEPAWLNEENLLARAQFVDSKRMSGHSTRKVVNYSPLRDVQDWLFSVAYDRAVFEIQASNVPVRLENSVQPVMIPLFRGFFGDASNTFEHTLSVIRTVLRNRNARLGIGNRHNRVVSVESGDLQIVPNIFQLSSGETALLSLFLSILRDYELTGSAFEFTKDIRGIVVVDEVDLHLHAVHQYEILPSLIKLFPGIQFIVTTHSPLFVLGMKRAFGEEGFALYEMPIGQQISPEEFGEFGSAYQSLTETRRFSEDIRQAIVGSRKPIVFVEGETDIRYLKKAAEILGREALLDEIELCDGEGHGGLDKIWKRFDSKLSDVIAQSVVLLFDCDKTRSGTKGNVIQRNVLTMDDHPVRKGIENLFDRATLKRARANKRAFVDITPSHPSSDRGKPITVPEKWVIHHNEKMNLCNWLCKSGTRDDFRHFDCVFELIEELLGIVSPSKSNAQETSP